MNHIEQASYHRQHIETKDTNIPKQAKRQITNTNKAYKFHKVIVIHHAAQTDQHDGRYQGNIHINEAS